MHMLYAMKTPLFHIVFTLVYFLTLRPGNRGSIEWQRIFFISKVWLLKSFWLRQELKKCKCSSIRLSVWWKVFWSLQSSSFGLRFFRITSGVQEDFRMTSLREHLKSTSRELREQSEQEKKIRLHHTLWALNTSSCCGLKVRTKNNVLWSIV